MLQRARQSAADPQQGQQDDDVEDERLTDQPAAKALRPVTRARLRHHPFARFIFRRQRQSRDAMVVRTIAIGANADAFPAAQGHDGVILHHANIQDIEANIIEHRHCAPFDVRARLSFECRRALDEARAHARRGGTVGPVVERIDHAIDGRGRLAGQFQPGPFTKQQGEIDRLRDKQRQRDDQDDLAHQTLRP